MDYKLFVADCDLDLKQGRSTLVGQRLSKLILTEVPRSWRLPLAALSGRAGRFSLGLRLLGALIHPDRNRWGPEVTPQELTEYGLLLSKNGNNSEALSILSRVSGNDVPQAILYSAFCQMVQWKFAEASILIEEFLETHPQPYSQLIAKVNLAACAVGLSQWSVAESLLRETAKMAKGGHYHRLWANSLELRGQIYVRRRQWQKATEVLDQAAGLLGAEGNSDQLFIRKWRSILRAFKENSLEPLDEFRQFAQQKGHWESVRDSDRFALHIQFDEARFHYLVFGTPHENFRQTLIHELGRSPQISTYKWGQGGPTLNLQTGRCYGDRPMNRRVTQVLSSLSSDFYRPKQLGALFSDLFPMEQFDIFSSHNRVHQSLWRVRHWLLKNEIPLPLRKVQGGFRIFPDLGVELLVPLRIPTREEAWLNILQIRFGIGEFNSAEATELLKISRPSFQRWAQSMIRNGGLCRRFRGSASCYSVQNPISNYRVAPEALGREIVPGTAEQCPT